MQKLSEIIAAKGILSPANRPSRVQSANVSPKPKNAPQMVIQIDYQASRFELSLRIRNYNASKTEQREQIRGSFHQTAFRIMDLYQDAYAANKLEKTKEGDALRTYSASIGIEGSKSAKTVNRHLERLNTAGILSQIGAVTKQGYLIKFADGIVQFREVPP